MLRADGAVEHDLQQHVAQLVRDLHRILAVHRLGGLAGLLDHELAQRVMRLRSVPRAAARSTQPRDHLHKVLVARPGAIIDADRRDEHRRPVVVMALPVQLAQGDGPRRGKRLRRVFKEIHGHLIVKQVAKPELDVGGQASVVDLRDDLRAVRLHAQRVDRQRRDRAQVLRIDAIGQHGAGRVFRERHAALYAQRDSLGQRLRKRADGRVVCRLADSVAKRLRLRGPGDERLCRQRAELVKVLALLIERVERLKGDALPLKQLRRGVAARAQHEHLRRAHRGKRPERQKLARVRPERENRDRFHALFSTLSMMKRGRRFVSL